MIWGSPEGSEVDLNGAKEKVFKGELTPHQTRIVKDRIIGRIADSITPTPRGITMHEIELKGGGYVYIFDIEKSISPPHQFQNIYYMRMDGHTRAAPHSYIEALMKQVRLADVSSYLSIGSSIPTSRYGIVPAILTVHNYSKFTTAHDVNFTLAVSDGKIFHPGDHLKIDELSRISNNTAPIPKLIYNIPIVHKFYLMLPETFGEVRTLKLKIQLYADNSPLKFSKYNFQYQSQTNYPTPQLQLLDSTENILSYEQPETLNLTDRERINKLADLELIELRHDFDREQMSYILNS